MSIMMFIFQTGITYPKSVLQTIKLITTRTQQSITLAAGGLFVFDVTSYVSVRNVETSEKIIVLVIRIVLQALRAAFSY